MSYLYSKLPETGVPHHIGTGGDRSVIALPIAPVDAIQAFPITHCGDSFLGLHGCLLGARNFLRIRGDRR